MELLTVKEVAALLKMSVGWVRKNYVTLGMIKVGNGKSVRFSKEKVQQFIASCPVKTA